MKPRRGQALKAARTRPERPTPPLIRYAERALPVEVLAYALECWGPRVLEMRRASSVVDAVEMARDLEADAVEVLVDDRLCWACVRRG